MARSHVKDHQHDYSQLHFVNPTTDEGKTLTELLKQLTGLNESWLPDPALQSSPSHTVRLADQPTVMSWGGWHPPPIHWPPPIPAPNRQFQCAACVAAHMAVAAAIGYAIATAAPELLANPEGLAALAARLGVDVSVVSAAIGGLGGAALAKLMCKNVC